MEQQLLHDIPEILQGGVSLNLASYVLVAVIVGVGAYVGTYLRTKGQNLATKEDVAEITRKVEEVRAIYAQQLEMLSHENRLRLAAVERRLQAHQEAYTLWFEVFWAVHKPEIHDVVVKCQDWFSRNCLYLTHEAREAFVQAYRTAGMYSELRKSLTKEEKAEDWRKIRLGGEIILRSVGLPGFAKGEIDSAELNKGQDG